MKKTKKIHFSLKHSKSLSLVTGLSVLTLAACSNNNQNNKASEYTDLNQCISDNPNQIQLCEAAYETALKKSEAEAPRYTTKKECQEKFGNLNCEEITTHSTTTNNNQVNQPTQENHWFIPLMSGFLLSQGLNHFKNTQPLYTSYAPSSPMYNRLGIFNHQQHFQSIPNHYYQSSNSSNYYGGSNYSSSYSSHSSRYHSNTYTSPTTHIKTRTISRGGFGSGMAVRSNSSHHSSWGG